MILPGNHLSKVRAATQIAIQAHVLIDRAVRDIEPRAISARTDQHVELSLDLHHLDPAIDHSRARRRRQRVDC